MKNTTDDKLISVIVPIYNAEAYLSRCIDSILGQKYKNIELILVDDGSTDSSAKVCDEYATKDARVKVYHQRNSGVSAARNNGIDKSKGDYIAFVDADDYLDRNFAGEILKQATKNNADYVCCGYKRVYNDHEEVINGDGSRQTMSPDELPIDLLNVQNGHGFAHMKLIKKSAIGDARFDEKIKVGEDALFNIVLCKNINKAVIYNKPLYNYVFNSNSVVRKYDKKYPDKYLQSMKFMRQYILKNYRDYDDVIQNLYNYIAYHVLLICVNYCYHPLNENKYASLKKVCSIDLFRESIAKSKYDNMSISRKIALFCLKHKLYLMMSVICRVRQYQFKKSK